jgi:hypothetical protein
MVRGIFRRISCCFSFFENVAQWTLQGYGVMEIPGLRFNPVKAARLRGDIVLKSLNDSGGIIR